MASPGMTIGILALLVSWSPQPIMGACSEYTSCGTCNGPRVNDCTWCACSNTCVPFSVTIGLQCSLTISNDRRCTPSAGNLPDCRYVSYFSAVMCSNCFCRPESAGCVWCAANGFCSNPASCVVPGTGNPISTHIPTSPAIPAVPSTTTTTTSTSPSSTTTTTTTTPCIESCRTTSPCNAACGSTGTYTETCTCSGQRIYSCTGPVRAHCTSDSHLHFSVFNVLH